MVNPSLYLLVGKEEFLKKEFIRNLKNSLFKNASEQDLNFREFDAASGGLAGFKEFLQTQPFLSEKRLAVLSELENLEEGAEQGLLSFLGSFPSSAAAVFISRETSDKKSPFLSSLSKCAKTVPCHPPFDKDLPFWVATRSKSLGIRLEPSASRLLIDKTGKDIAALLSALEMLGTYVHPRKEVAAADVEALLGRSLQNDVFSLVDLLLKKNAKSALSTVAGFLKEGIRGFEIVAVLAGQFERMRKANALMDQGFSGAQVGAELKVHPFFLDKFIAQARSISRADLKKIFQELLLCDESIKTSALRESLAVERLVLSLCVL